MIQGTRHHPFNMARMPRKTGRCAITGCERTPTQWHHIIAQGRIKRKNLDPALLTDPGNLVEFCIHHHDMTTASLVRKELQERKEQEEWERASKEMKRKGLVWYCDRCGREGHERDTCAAKTTVDRERITTKSWKYRPKAKPRKKAKKSKRSQCEAMTDVGSRCSLQKAKGARVCHVHKRLRVRPWKW